MEELLSASEAWHLLMPERRLNSESELRRTFATLDLNGDGKIDPGELRIALIALNGMPSPGFSQTLLDAQVDQMISWADLDNTGMISFEEYQNIIEAGCDPESGGRLATKLTPSASRHAGTETTEPQHPVGIPVVSSEGSTIYL